MFQVPSSLYCRCESLHGLQMQQLQVAVCANSNANDVQPNTVSEPVNQVQLYTNCNIHDILGKA